FDARTKLPLWIAESLPVTTDDLKSFAADWLGEHSKEVQHVGNEATHMFVRGLVGMVIGALVSLREGPHIRQMRPLAAGLGARIDRFANAFPPDHFCPSENLRFEYRFYGHISRRDSSSVRSSSA